MGHRLKEIRIERGLSQRELAKKTGLSQSYITAIERNVRDMDLRLIELFAKALNCKPYELLPVEWQPQVSEADLQLLRAIKTLATDKKETETSKDSKVQKENQR
jgi:transcriptional regulator with XRE-family HTH domain